MSNNPDQELDLRKSNIPDTFDSLIKEVTSSYGLPLSYIQFHKANLLEMLIPPRSKRGYCEHFNKVKVFYIHFAELSSLYEMDMPAYVRDDELFSHGTEEEEGSNRSQSIKKEQKSSLNFIVVLSTVSFILQDLYSY